VIGEHTLGHTFPKKSSCNFSIRLVIVAGRGNNDMK